MRRLPGVPLAQCGFYSSLSLVWISKLSPGLPQHFPSVNPGNWLNPKPAHPSQWEHGEARLRGAAGTPKSKGCHQNSRLEEGNAQTQPQGPILGAKEAPASPSQHCQDIPAPARTQPTAAGARHCHQGTSHKQHSSSQTSFPSHAPISLTPAGFWELGKPLAPLPQPRGEFWAALPAPCRWKPQTHPGARSQQLPLFPAPPAASSHVWIFSPTVRGKKKNCHRKCASTDILRQKKMQISQLFTAHYGNTFSGTIKYRIID